ncbi:NHLP leader peptide family RiPP precursor [uncultured Kordia sp.]|uniref:NHLP leader peptide family RiPP precursor n=1 Tax=uncultured Kordia sp. TaxID=507699 RepID=UPI00263354E7|nr:NHLP leader peptide family RiPP precursor [uncultured Kordia sp.]
MESTEQQEKANEFLASIYKKAWEDEGFKRNLISNPIETLNKFTGKKANISIDKNVMVEDQTNPNHVYINIPAKPAGMEDVELTEDQLETVSGGNFENPLYIDWGSLIDGVKEEVSSWFD